MSAPKYIIADGSCDNQIVDYDQALLVPVETLDDETKEALEGDDTGDLLKWTRFPGIHISTLVEKLEELGLLNEILEDCRQARSDIDNGVEDEDEDDEDYDEEEDLEDEEDEEDEEE